jgi:transposase
MFRHRLMELGVTIGSVSNWVSNFEHEGFEGLLTKARPGRPAELMEEELLLLDDLVDAGALASGFPNDLWDARWVAAVIHSHFCVSYHPHHVATKENSIFAHEKSHFPSVANLC